MIVQGFGIRVVVVGRIDDYLFHFMDNCTSRVWSNFRFVAILGSEIPDVKCDEVQTDIKGLDMKEVGAPNCHDSVQHSICKPFWITSS